MKIKYFQAVEMWVEVNLIEVHELPGCEIKDAKEEFFNQYSRQSAFYSTQLNINLITDQETAFLGDFF